MGRAPHGALEPRRGGAVVGTRGRTGLVSGKVQRLVRHAGARRGQGLPGSHPASRAGEHERLRGPAGCLRRDGLAVLCRGGPDGNRTRDLLRDRQAC